MEPIRISSPADAISYMGHSLGYWPQEGLVCVALDGADEAPPSAGTCPAPRTPVKATPSSSPTPSASTTTPPQSSSPCSPTSHGAKDTPRPSRP